MNCNATLKLALLSLLVVNLVIQSGEAYSLIKYSPDKLSEIVIPKNAKESSIFEEKIAEAPPTQSKPKRPVIVTSDVAMVWMIPEKNELGYHIIDHKSFENLKILAMNISAKDFDAFTDQAKDMSTAEFLALVNTPNFKEQFKVEMIASKQKN